VKAGTLCSSKNFNHAYIAAINRQIHNIQHPNTRKMDFCLARANIYSFIFCFSLFAQNTLRIRVCELNWHCLTKPQSRVTVLRVIKDNGFVPPKDMALFKDLFYFRTVNAHNWFYNEEYKCVQKYYEKSMYFLEYIEPIVGVKVGVANFF